jgi:hypothetical protein
MPSVVVCRLTSRTSCDMCDYWIDWNGTILHNFMLFA